MPLVRSFTLSKKKGNEAYVQPMFIDSEFSYSVKYGKIQKKALSIVKVQLAYTVARVSISPIFEMKVPQDEWVLCLLRWSPKERMVVLIVRLLLSIFMRLK